MKAYLKYIGVVILFLTVCVETVIIHTDRVILKHTKELLIQQLDVNKLQKKGALELADWNTAVYEQNVYLAKRSNECENFVFHRGEWFIFRWDKHDREEEMINGKGAV